MLVGITIAGQVVLVLRSVNSGKRIWIRWASRLMRDRFVKREAAPEESYRFGGSPNVAMKIKRACWASLLYPYEVQSQYTGVRFHRRQLDLYYPSPCVQNIRMGQPRYLLGMNSVGGGVQAWGDFD
jgi:hypothetical protein